MMPILSVSGWCTHYGRYVDDLVLLAGEPERLLEWRERGADVQKGCACRVEGARVMQ